MVYPQNFEDKIEFTVVRKRLKELCLSTMGHDKVDEMIFMSDIISLEAELNRLNEFKDIIMFENDFPISHYIDVRRILDGIRIEGSFPDLTDVFDLKRSLDTIKSLIHFFKSREDNKYPNLLKLVGTVPFFPYVVSRIDQIISQHGKIKDNASPDLLGIRRRMSEVTQQINKRIHSILREVQANGWTDAESGPSMRDGRLVIPVFASDKRKLKGIIHDESATGKTSFIEPAEVVELNNEVRELEYAEKREIIKILTLFANDIRPYIDELKQAYAFLAEIDFLQAKAKFAVQTGSMKPAINNHPMLRWYDAFHPLLFLHLKLENKEIVKQDLEMDERYRLLIISGPNAGGKSVLLKTTGIIQYMLQCGMLVPLKSTSEMGIFKKIFIDIGDEQSIENDLSTYSSHLLNMKYFLRHSDKDTLILIDEFGAGTEPAIGGAIAESVLESLNKKEVKGVITTHYTNLKHLAAQSDGLFNGAMLYDTQHLQPAFKLKTGEPGSSFAFEIARKIGLDEQILSSAASKVGENQINIDKYLKEVIRDKYYWERKRDNVKQHEKRLGSLVNEYSGELEDIKKLRKEIITNAKEEAKALLQNVNKSIETTIRQIKEANAEKEKTKEIRKNIEELKTKVFSETISDDDRITRKMNKILDRERNKNSNQPQFLTETIIKKEEVDIHTFQVGDKVKLVGKGTLGEVLEVNGKSIMIALGQMITTVSDRKIAKVSKNEFDKLEKKRSTSANPLIVTDFSQRKLDFKSNIDVRGKRVEEVIPEIEKYIDEAIMVGVSEVRILHGKGNGILKQVIRDLLKTFDLIDSVTDEHVEFGGAGITIVRFNY